MTATPHDTWTLEEDEPVTASLEEARAHDAYWAAAHARENYFRAGLDYEDYAPAYCVGYIGRVQYGGDYEDAEKSLLANWLRIKGGSRLDLEEARMAIRAAWDRAAQPAEQPAVQPVHASVFERSLRGLLETANRWLDRLEGRRGGARPPAPRPIARRPQPGSLARR